MRSKHWSKTKNGINAYIDNLKKESMLKKEERERLKKIVDFRVGQEIEVFYKGKLYGAEVTRINDKTYTVQFTYGKVLIGKETHCGYPESVIKCITGDGRRYVGESVRIVNKNDKDIK